MLSQSYIQLHNDIPPLWQIQPWRVVFGGQIQSLSQCLGQRVQLSTEPAWCHHFNTSTPELDEAPSVALTNLIRSLLPATGWCWGMLQWDDRQLNPPATWILQDRSSVIQLKSTSSDSLSSLSCSTFREVERLGTQVRKSTLIQQKSIRSEWKLAKIAFVVIVVYVLSWSPYACVTLISWAG